MKKTRLRLWERPNYVLQSIKLSAHWNHNFLKSFWWYYQKHGQFSLNKNRHFIVSQVSGIKAEGVIDEHLSQLFLSADVKTERGWYMWSPMWSPEYSNPPHIGFLEPEGKSKSSSLGTLSTGWSLGNSAWRPWAPHLSWQVYNFQLLFIWAREKFVSSGQTFNWAWPAAELCNFPWCGRQHIITSGIQLDNSLSTKS